MKLLFPHSLLFLTFICFTSQSSFDFSLLDFETIDRPYNVLSNSSTNYTSSCQSPACLNLIEASLGCYTTFQVIGQLNYAKFVYCYWKGNETLGLVLVFFFLLCLFIWSGTLASGYTTPNIVCLAKFINLPDHIAGLTVVAIGNGLPDIISNLISTGKAANYGLAFGSITGLLLYSSSFMFGVIALASNGFKIPLVLIYRDLVFSMVVCLAFGFILLDGQLLWYEGLGLISVYVLYVFIVLITNFLHKNTNGDEKSRQSVTLTESDTSHNTYKSLIRSYKIAIDFAENIRRNVRVTSLEQSVLASSAIKSTSFENDIDSFLELENGFVKEVLSVECYLSNELCGACSALEVNEVGKLKLIKYHFLPILSTWGINCLLGKTVSLVNFIPVLLFQLTVPVMNRHKLDCDQSKVWHHRYIFLLQLVLGPLLFLVIENDVNSGVFQLLGQQNLVYIPLWSISIIISFLLGALFLFLSSGENRPAYLKLLAVPGFIFGLVWSYIMNMEIVSILSFISFVFQLPPSFTGMTIYVIATNIGDVASSINSSKMGMSVLALSSIFGNQIITGTMNIGLVGFINGMSGTIVFKKSKLLIVCLGLVLFVYIAHFIHLIAFKRYIGKFYGVVAIIFYCLSTSGLGVLAFT